MRKLLFSALSLLIALVPLSAAAKKVHTIGDSTMATYQPEDNKKGWGQMFQQFLEGIEVNNRAKSGSSSKSFYKESAYWESVKKQISAGDYVLIQFAHNDEKNGGADGDELIALYESLGQSTAGVDYRGTTASGTYKDYLRKYIQESRALGATPILVAPICRKYFTGNTIRRNGRHDLGDNFSVIKNGQLLTGQKVAETDHTYDYPYQMNEVAKEMNVPFIDITTATADLYASYGETKCTELLFCPDDGTHTSAMGATLIARLAAQLLQEQGLMTEHIRLTSELTASPSVLDFGDAYKGQSLTRDFYISGFSLTPASGTLTITAPAGVLVSTDKVDYQQSVRISYEGGNVIGTVYARAKFENEGALSGEITVSDGTNNLTIPVKGNCISLGTNSVESSAYWRLESDDECTVNGPFTSLGQTFSNMKVQRYQAPNANTVWPEETGFTPDRKTQRCLIEGDNWPAGEIDEVSNRYIEFAVKVADGATMNVDKISMYVGGAGGSGMRCKVYYSKEADFANPVLIKEHTSMPGNTMLLTEATPALKLTEGETLRVRVYPWYNGAASGKTICLSDVTIHGWGEFAQQAIETVGSVTWPFDKGNDTPTVADTDVPDAISSTSFSFGDNLYINGSQTANSGVMLNKLNPREAVARARDAKTYVCYSIVPKKGVSFVPQKLEFDASKFGTSGGTFDVVVVRNGVETTIATNVNPARNNVDPFHTHYNYGLESVNPGDRLDVYIYIYNLAANKQLGIANVKVTGQFVGNPVTVPVYSITAATSDEAAGTVKVNPAGSKFDEGTEITVTATENFGYHFKAWVDAENKEVSTENPYKFELMADTDLKAVYTKNNVYSVVVNLEGGANVNLVQFSPAGNVVNGIHHYEEGTEITLTALNNRIMTFTNWSDNSTDAVRNLKVTDNVELTASFSAADYIVGWDLYFDEPKQERAADFKADSENAGLLSLRNAEGQTAGWLAGGVEKGGQRGHYCARNWRPINADYYFEISFSSVGYSNLKLSALAGNDFVSYAKYEVQYSTDGTNFTKFGEYVMPNRGWAEGENALPSDADNQKCVWIRFMPDKEFKSADTGSVFTGSGWDKSTVLNESDGFSVAEIFVLADSDSSSDEIAPKLLSSIPENNSEGASANGQIILTFDEKVVLAKDVATLNGSPIAGAVTGKTATFKYLGLDYASEYTFVLPAGAITDRNGNAYEGCTLKFRTMERVQPEARLFDAVVAQDGSGDYKTVSEAIEAAPAQRVKPWLIFVKEGYYKEHVEIPESKPFIHLIGENRDNVRICDNLLSGGDNALHVDLGATFVAKSNDLYFEGISFENEYGRDKNDGPQALALNTKGDRVAFRNVKMISYQDTWITTSQSNYRHYVTDSWIEGAVDFIYNSGNVFIENSTLNIVRKSGGYIVAPRHYTDTRWGYVFVNNTITAPGVPSETSVWLGRPWHDYPKTVFINTRAEVTIPAKGWYETMGGLPVLWADYNTVDGNGNPVDLSQRQDTYYITNADGSKTYGKAKNYLTAEEAAEYTVKNVLTGDDNWQPALIAEPCAAPVVKLDKSAAKLVWEEVPYAICYVIRRDGKVVDFTTDTIWSSVLAADSKYSVQSVSEYGALSAEGVAASLDSVEDILGDEADAVYYNLQGMRVDNPAAGGVYIRVRGNVSEKIAF